ncbi:MAG: pilus assembly protein [Actinobacteria bacterium]|nr:pilus assembly protein [Actinomycetota bacterium]
MTGAHPQGRRVASLQDGSFTLEAVVLAPVLVLFALLMIMLGRYVQARAEVIGAARAAAQVAAVQPSAAEARQAALGAATGDVRSHLSSCSAVQVGVTTSSFRPGGVVSVKVECQVSFSSLGAPGMPGSALIHAAVAAPVDPYQSVP